MKKPAPKLQFDPPAEPVFRATVEKPWRDFRKGQVNPYQRDTEAHARVAAHLLTWHPKHAEVAEALLPDGRVILLDGHTRLLLWETGKTPEPPIPLRVDQWLVADEKMAGELKLLYDNRHATNQPHDVMFGVTRALKLDFKSQVLGGERKFLGTIRLTEKFLNPSREDIVDALLPTVSRWVRELRLFDQAMPTWKKFNTALQTASLLLLRHYGDAVLPFLKAHQAGQGDKHGTKFSAQEAFGKRYEALRKDTSIWSGQRNEAIVRLAVSGYLEVEADKWFEEGVSNLRTLDERQFQKWLAKTREVSNDLH